MSTCLMATGRKLPCKDVVGGIKTVYFADYGTLGTITITAGVVTALSGAGTNFYKYDVKGGNNLEQTITSSDENGTTFYGQTLTVVLTKLDEATQVELQKMIVQRPHVFVEDNNGNYFAVGLTRGCNVNGTISTGTALGDMAGYTLTVTAEEPIIAPFVTSTVVTSRASATQITP
jgi:hypothetical protein